MRQCEQLQSYLDQRLRPEDRSSFEQHLSVCSNCRAEAAEWRGIEQQIPGWLESTAHEAPTQFEITRLEALARESKTPHWSRFTWRHALVAGAAAVVLIIFSSTQWFSPASMPGSRRLADQVASMEMGEAPLAVPIYQALDHQALTEQLGRDTIALHPASQARLTGNTDRETLLTLDHGSIACQVAGRTAGKTFAVQAGEFTVRVIGTEFLVTHRPDRAEPLTVVVSEGTVQVDSRAQSWTVGAGKTLRVRPDLEHHAVVAANAAELSLVAEYLPRAVENEPKEILAVEQPSARPEPRRPSKIKKSTQASNKSAKSLETISLSEVRKKLAAGDVSEATGELEQHLARRPKDAAAWSLHGDCLRKSRNWRGAVRSYDQAVANGDTGQASRARYLAAQVLQKNLRDHKAAVTYYEKYISSGNETIVMIDVAKINMARSLIALGQNSRAGDLLRAVIRDQGDSFVATNARHLLQKLE